MTSRVRMLRSVTAAVLLLIVCAAALPSHKGKRQVTYEDDANGSEQKPDVHLIHPVTRKPLPAQVVYPGDLRMFYTTEKPGNLKEDNSTAHSSQRKFNSPENSHLIEKSRAKRTLNGKTDKENRAALMLKLDSKSTQSKLKLMDMSESRLHSSYHKPSVSLSNDIPAEMYFDGAGFLRYEDDSEETKSTPEKSPHNDRSAPRSNQENSKALRDFREAFNISHDRESSEIKYDDDVRYPESSLYSRTSQERPIDYGAQGTENGTPLGMDFMNAYQREMFANMHSNYAQTAPNPSTLQQDPFSFTYPNFYNNPTNFNQMPTPQVQQEPLLQNHRLQSTPNLASGNVPTVYASSSHPVQANPGYASNINYQQYHKIQRKKRSAVRNKRTDDSITSASVPNQDHYQYSGIPDQQDSSSAYIPITGSFNGGTIQLNFPVFGNNPGYSSRPPMQTYHTYSVPIQPDGRTYRNSMERFYHPSEARRYSYGILGSGNFEVIRGGVFPGEQQTGYSGGYQGARIPYENDYGNYGTTEIILDGPLQGFQGFDNFQAHLINALSKHSEVAIHPERREGKER